MPVITFMLTVSLISFGSCGGDDHKDNPKDSAEEMNDEKFDTRASEKDAQFMVDAASDGLAEVRMAEHARDRATTQDVKDLAAAMIAAHTTMNAQVKALAAQKNITIPADLTEKQTKDIADLDEKTGIDFDKAYTDKLISMHKDAINLFEKASSNAEDQQIRDLFVGGLPELRHHLDMAQATDDKLENMKK
jgi:putative membrane protein